MEREKSGYYSDDEKHIAELTDLHCQKLPEIRALNPYNATEDLAAYLVEYLARSESERFRYARADARVVLADIRDRDRHKLNTENRLARDIGRLALAAEFFDVKWEDDNGCAGKGIATCRVRGLLARPTPSLLRFTKR